VANGRDRSELPTEGVGSSGTKLRRVGPYRLLAELGEGGMGVVYEALQARPLRRRVALKLIKRGMDTEKVVARFESERQALALMNHPGIAKVLDAAETEDGRPYFVMELVRGLPLNKHCDARRFTIPQRLDVFLDVCSAVHHAHQRGVIHRDLKPSNILVTDTDDKSVPKIIDFGIAKATTHSLTDRSLLTEHGQFVGTPEFMSPEQASSDCQDIDIRTDVYSLGVALYELLTGTTPFATALRTSDLGEMRRRIQTEDARRPSQRVTTLDDRRSVSHRRQSTERELARRLNGDLDWIVLKALEKDRERRYGTVAEFATDIRRHLDDLPVEASPPSMAYRIRKFVRRHRTGLTFGAAMAVLVAGLAVAVGVILAQERRIKRMVDQLEPGQQEVLLMGMGLEGDALDRLTQTVSRLENVDRAESQRPVAVLSALNIRTGERVADIGAGSGYFTVPISQIVGSSGQVWALDVDQGMLDFLDKRLRLQDIANVRLLQVPPDDPRLPTASIDTVLLVDTYRYLGDRTAYAEKLRMALAPGGRVVVIDEMPQPGSSHDSMIIPRSTVDEEMAAAGFRPARSHEVLPHQYFVEYELR